MLISISQYSHILFLLFRLFLSPVIITTIIRTMLNMNRCGAELNEVQKKSDEQEVEWAKRKKEKQK